MWVEKTTVYLPDELKAHVKRAARLRGVSEATVIRDAIRAAVSETRPRPRGGLYASDELVADRVDELLAGFGER
jgi:metal-responsive CopG/Arc/MetJ family transcriptional regulator